MRSQAPAILEQARPASPRERMAHDRQVIASVQNQLVPVLILDDVFQGGTLPGYVAGDVVGLPAGIAETYVSAGVASYDLDAGPRRKARPTEMVGGTQTAAAGGPVRMKMVRPWGTLQPGDLAGFNPELARELDVKGVARLVPAPSPLRRTLRDLRNALTGGR